MPPIKGKLKKPLPKNPVQILEENAKKSGVLIQDFSNFKEKAKEEFETKLEEVNSSVKHVVNQAISIVEQTKEEAIQVIKDIKQGDRGEKGDKGDPAEPVDKQEIVNEVLSRIEIPEPQVIDIESIKEEILSSIPVPKPIDENKLLAKFLRNIPEKKGDLKIITEQVETDPLSVVDKIMELVNDGKLKLKTKDIDGLEQTIQAFQSQLGRGYLHGGGDTVVAGTGITITTNANGNKVISADISGVQTPWLSDIDADGYDLTDLGDIQFRSDGLLKGYYPVIGSTTFTGVGTNDILIRGVFGGGHVIHTFTYTITDTSGYTVIPVSDTSFFAVSDPVEDDQSIAFGTVEYIVTNKYLIISTSDDWSSATFIINSSTFDGTAITSTPYISDLGTFTDGITTVTDVPIITFSNSFIGIVDGLYPSSATKTGHTIGDVWTATTEYSLDSFLYASTSIYDYYFGDVNTKGYGNKLIMNVSSGKSQFSFRDRIDNYLNLDTLNGLYRLGPANSDHVLVDTVNNSIKLGTQLSSAGGPQVYMPGLVSGSGTNLFLRIQSSDGRVFTAPGTALGDIIGGSGTGVLFTEGTAPNGVLLEEPEFYYSTSRGLELGRYAEFLDGPYVSPNSSAAIKLSSSEDGDTGSHEPVMTWTDNSGSYSTRILMDSRSGMNGDLFLPYGPGTFALTSDVDYGVRHPFWAYATATSNYNVGATDTTIDCTSGTFNVTLPSAVGILGRLYVVKNTGGGVITINTTSSQTIDGLSSGTITLTTDEWIIVQSNGADWIIIGQTGGGGSGLSQAQTLARLSVGF